MQKSTTFIFLIVIMMMASLSFAQLNDATVSGPPTKGANLQSVEVHPQPVPMDQRVPRTNTPPMSGNEYGSFNYNAYCNTGSTAGYVAIGNTNYNENVDGAVECWVNPTSATPTAPVIVGKGDALAGSFLLIWLNTGSLGFRIGNTFTACTVTGNVPLNTWTHVGVSWTGAPGAYTVSFFVNGALAGTTVANNGTWSVNNDSITIGSTKAAFSNKDFVGFIDEVRIWLSPRTAAEFALNRFVGLGDGGGANTGSALTSSTSYANLFASFTFNTGGNAYDDIGGFTGYYRNGAGAVYHPESSNPLPYNFALKLGGAANDYVTVPTSTAFDQTAAGSIDAWIRPSVVGTLQTICSKGTSFATHNFAFYISAGNKLGLNIGAHNYISTGPTTFVADKWYHVAATWSGGPNFTVNLYVNGALDYTATFNLAMPTNSDPFIIGRYYSASTGLFNGYIDEVRVWGNALTPANILKYMFVSCRSGALPSCVAAYNFDGNLLNFGSATGINGSFNNGATNNGRFSGYTNENLTGAPANTFIAYPTVLNRTGTALTFPAGFNLKLSNKDVISLTTVKDTLSFATSRAITSVELFLSIQHTYVNDLTITLTAPNGTSRSVVASTGGTGEGILTFFTDGGPLCSTTGFFAPWSYYAGPAVAFGNFGSANMLGNWILTVADGVGGDDGKILGWGLRFNGDVATGITPISNNTPDKFELFQNYPNPFNPTTSIKFNVATNSNVKLVIYDVLGKEVTTLVNEFKAAGSYKVDFDASKLSSGVYFYRIEAGKFTDVKKMTLIK